MIGTGERLGHKPRAYVLERLQRDLSEAKPSRAVLVTYNRVGDGLLPPRTTRDDLTLDIYTGLSMTTITEEQMIGSESERAELPALLAPEQVADFYGQVRQELLSQIPQLDKPTVFVIYGGDLEKYRLVVEMVNKVAIMTQLAGKGDLAKFFILTCNCDLAEKIKLASPLYELGLLESVIYNPGGACGGLGDMETIATTVLAGRRA